MSEPDDRIELLPHGPAARMIERIRSRAPGTIETEMPWSVRDARIAAHFPPGPSVVPGVFLAEQVAQSALLLAILDGLAAPKELFVVGQLRCDFVRPALAPCTVLARVILTAQVKGSVGFQGECQTDSEIVARIKGVAMPAPARP